MSLRMIASWGSFALGWFETAQQRSGLSPMTIARSG
jgi:hypothetical protein